MPRRVRRIARVRLARSVRRILVAPLVLLVLGVVAITAGLALVGDVAGLAMAGAGAVAVAVSPFLALIPLTVRLDVEQATVRVTWLTGRQVYGLAPGVVTRVHLRGPNASRLRARFGIGWALGPGKLRGEERIHVVRLAPTTTAILVPTDRGRLAVAPADEQELLDALSRAAQARARAAELARAVPAAGSEPLVTPVAPPVTAQPGVMTGIERALLEERVRLSREPEAGAVDSLASASSAAEPPAPTTDTAAEPVRGRPRRQGRLRLLRRPGAAAVLPLLPLAGAAGAWAVGLSVGRMPTPGTDLGRLTALGLVLVGPATTIGAILAAAWWPRISGVVVIVGLVGCAFIARALLGPLN